MFVGSGLMSILMILENSVSAFQFLKFKFKVEFSDVTINNKSLRRLN